jgi:hypothetical protein
LFKYHWYVSPADELSVVVSPGQIEVPPLTATVGAGEFETDTLTGFDCAEHPLMSVYVTEYVPEVVTTIDCVVAAVLQTLPKDWLEDNVTESPVQNEVEPLAVTVGAEGLALTETTTVSLF